MNRLLFLLLVSLTLTGCAGVNHSYMEHQTNITKYNTLIIKDFGLDDLAYPGKDMVNQEKMNPIFLSAARALSEDIGRVVMEKKIFDAVNINDFRDKGAVVLEGNFLWLGKHMIAVKGRLVDGVTDETILFFQHEEFDRTGTADLVAKMAEHIGVFIGSMRCTELPSFQFCPVR